MSLRSIMLQLRDDQIEQLDAQASRSGTSRSRLVRDAVDSMLSPPRQDDIRQRYRRAYPLATFGDDEFGNLDDWHAAASASGAAERDAW